jgi:uncharacterized protein HemY
LVFYLVGDFVQAARAYRQNMLEHPELYDMSDPAFAALVRGNGTTAERLAHKALGEHPKDLGALLTLGHEAMEAKKPSEALDYFNRVRNLRKDQYAALLLTSIVYLQLPDSPAATATIQIF